MRLTTPTLNALVSRERPYEVRDDQRRGLLVRVQPSGRKLFYFEHARGRRIALGAYPEVTLALARGECVRVIERLARGEEARPQYRRPAERQQPGADAAMTLAALYRDYYLPWFTESRKARGYRANGLEPLATALKDSDLGSVAVDALNIDDVVAWRERQTGIRPATINRRASGLRSLMNFAVENGHAPSNPLAGLRRLSEANPTGRRTVRALTAEEEASLRAAVDGRTDHMKPLVALALGSGMRRGEMFRLRWRDIDFAASTIEVRVTKSGRPRVVNLSDRARCALLAWRPADWKPDALAFPGPDGRPLTTIKRAWSTVREAAGIEWSGIHCLRHTHASRLLASGAPLIVVSRQLGHSVAAVTDLYAHVDPRGALAAVRNL